MPMHITDWKENFISKMITRGRDYWRAGAVKNLHCTQEKITADVEGTWLYRVEITLAGDAVATLSCTCPFAKEGANCKHMAAVLFAATHLPEAELPAPEWEKKLNSLSAETLRDFLRPLLKKDEALRNRLMLCKGDEPVRADERRLNWQRTLTQTLPADAWRDEAERLLKLPTTSTIRLPLLASIEQWEQLLQRIQQHGNFEGLCTYFDPLMAWDSARTLALYRDMVNRAMQGASSRATYCEIIQRLERMKGTDEGRQIIADLAVQWRRDYKRKCALLDELQKAGY